MTTTIDLSDAFYCKVLQYSIKIGSKKRYTLEGMRKKILQYIEKRGAEDDIKRSEDYMEKILARLSELNYLNDEQFAKDFISERLKFKPKGQILLNRELRTKGISVNVLDKVFTEVGIDEFGFGMKALLKRNKRWESFTVYERRSKAFRFLLSRGFKIDIIYKILDNCYSSSSYSRVF